MAFMLQIGRRTRHLVLGTATPIQTNVRELWDLLGILNSGAEFVLGDALSPWHDHEQAIPLITGQTQVTSEAEVWHWLSNPCRQAMSTILFSKFVTTCPLIISPLDILIVSKISTI